MASQAQKKLQGKVALVTGGSRGIGRAIAAAYTRAGASVYICGREQSAVDQAIDELRSQGGMIDGAAADIGSSADAKRLVQSALHRFDTIDVLVNNAGILGPRETIADYPISVWHEVIRINLTGLFLITHEVLPIMLAQCSGSIINVTSGVGRAGKAKWGAYAVAKAGLEGFTQVLADEVKPLGIRVNSVNPAATRTRMRAAAYPTEDPATLPSADSITPIFVYLASADSSSVTGQALSARDWLAKRD